MTAKHLKQKTGEIIKRVRSGEHLTITYRGKPHAKLIPFEDETVGEDELFGIWADYPQSEDVNVYVRTIRKGRFDAD